MYQNDIELILSLRNINGADYWATPDGAVAKGGPFSTLEASNLLADLGYPRSAPELVGAADAIFRNMKDDGRIRTFSSGTIYPCQTASAAKALCQLGYADDDRLARTYKYLLESQHDDGGWRCNTSKYGKGPETVYSNPGTTLTVLDVFRFTAFLNHDERLDRAVEFLLSHWVTRKPLGPCHYGIGTLFMKIEYPLVRYNTLNYVHVLSFYDTAKRDKRFLDAFDVVKSKLVDDSIVLENTNRKLKDFVSCTVDQKNDLATMYFNAARANLGVP
ncbi:MAG: prenyltransferase [Spirochaetaceae bacterium]|nr:MAG: prenyltransferase [Spirochaetaceae bacterium]